MDKIYNFYYFKIFCIVVVNIFLNLQKILLIELFYTRICLLLLDISYTHHFHIGHIHDRVIAVFEKIVQVNKGCC